MNPNTQLSEELLRIQLQQRMMAPAEVIDWIISLVKERDAGCRAVELVQQQQKEIERQVRLLMDRDREIHLLKLSNQAMTRTLKRIDEQSISRQSKPWI